MKPLIQFHYEDFREILDQLGRCPLPPYITHQLQDEKPLQTVYAKYDGSKLQLKTAGFISHRNCSEVRDMGVEIAK